MLIIIICLFENKKNLIKKEYLVDISAILIYKRCLLRILYLMLVCLITFFNKIQLF